MRSVIGTRLIATPSKTSRSTTRVLKSSPKKIKVAKTDLRIELLYQKMKLQMLKGIQPVDMLMQHYLLSDV